MTLPVLDAAGSIAVLNQFARALGNFKRAGSDALPGAIAAAQRAVMQKKGGTNEDKLEAAFDFTLFVAGEENESLLRAS